MEKKPQAAEESDSAAQRYEGIFGLSLAIFAAVLAVNELGSGKYGDDELRMATEKANAYLWYQSKGIKETLAEGQLELLKTLVDNDGLHEKVAGGTQKQIAKLEGQIKRYQKEKKEILLGSKAVGKENWVQDVDGTLGKVVGVKEMEGQLETLGNAGDRFDFATLFLQLALVFGAIGLLMRQIGRKRIFLGMLVVLGGIGTTCMALAFTIVSKL